jgi:hypothetical protein
MASLLDNILSFGATPPQYLGGLIGEDQLKNVQNRAMTTGIFNALVGYLATPKNQNLGLGRILGNTLMAGQQGAQGVYDQAIQDYQTTEKIKQMQLERALQAQKINDQMQMRRLAPQLIREVPAQTELVDQGTYFIPQPTAPDAVAPNYGLQPVVKEPIERVIAPARREIDPAVLQQLLATSSDPLATLKTTAELVPALRKAGLVQTQGMGDNPFQVWAETSQSPQVQKLARQYETSFRNGTIDAETADKRIADLAKAEESYIARTEGAADRKAQAQRDYDLRQQSLQQTAAYQQGQLANQQAQLALRQDIQAQKGQKTLPAYAFKAEGEDLDTAMQAVNLSGQTDSQIKSLITNKVDFSPVNKARLATKAFAGSTDPDVLAYNEYNNFVTRLVNESLRLNKGVQTEGDAQRAFKELSSARSTADVIRSLEKIRDINAKAAALRNDLVQARRKTSGLTEDRGYAPPERIDVPKYFPYIGTKAQYDKLPKNTQYWDYVNLDAAGNPVLRVKE